MDDPSYVRLKSMDGRIDGNPSLPAFPGHLGRPLYLIACGRKQIWDTEPLAGAVEAERAYTSHLHKLCKTYVRTFHCDWRILSAKYGFLTASDRIEGQYDVPFGKPHPERMDFTGLRRQARTQGLLRYTHIVVLAGQKYRVPVTETFGPGVALSFPFQRYRGIGYIQQALRQAIEDRIPWDL